MSSRTRTAPNVLFLLSDQHNHRYLGNVDEPVDVPVATPRLDELAATSTRFERTYCQSPLCTPSRMSMLTGRETRESGGWANHSYINPDVPTFPEVFTEAGYETSLVGKMHFGGDRQFCGFQNRPYGDVTGTTGHQFEPLFVSPPDYNTTKGAGKEYAHNYQREGALRALVETAGVTEIPESLLQEQNVAMESLAFLREFVHESPETPWFLCASFSRPHPPFTAPRRHFERYWPDEVTDPAIGFEGDTVDHPLTRYVRDRYASDDLDEEDVLRARAAYLACVSYLDEILDDFLATLDLSGFLENTIVVYVSDHGEMAGEHSLWGKRVWHEGSTRVPWYVQLPEHRSGAVDPASLSTLVSLADLFPTLCGLAGIETPDGLQGTDLSESVTDGTEPDRGPVFCDLLDPDEGNMYRMVRDGRYKYVQFEDAPALLFDMEADPNEQTDLTASTDSEHVAAVERYERLVDETMDFETVRPERRRAREELDRHELPISKGHGNAYVMPDDRIVDADTPLYRPYVLARNPEKVFEDWPGGSDSGT